MRQRNWTLYRVLLYLGLAIALGQLGIIIYLATLRLFGSSLADLLLLTIVVVHLTFYILSIRLIHHFVFKRLEPGRAFSIVHLVGLIANSVIAVGLLVLLARGVSEMFLQADSHPHPDHYLLVILMSGYTFITIYISAASIVLRRYNRLQIAMDKEKEWLNQLGNQSLNE